MSDRINEIEKMFDAMNKEMQELRAKYQERAKEVFKVAFKEFFTRNPEVTAIGWRQYTPYFNDGDTCTFRCYACYAFATNGKEYDTILWGEYNGEDPDEVWIDDPDYGGFNEELIPESVSADMEALRKMLSKVDDDVFLEMFGDHVQVFATSEGFDVQDYLHD